MTVQTYKTWLHVPEGFSGRCYLEDIKTHFVLKNKQRHNLVGPAVWTDHPTPSMYWCQYDSLHRLDGPAIVCPRYFVWAICGIEYKENNYWNHPLVVQYKLETILEHDETRYV